MSMVDGNLFIPLSPPSSPRMSAYSTTSADNEWQSSDVKIIDSSSAHSEGDMALLQAEVTGHNFDHLKRPLLHTHKSFPYTFDNKHQHGNGSDSPRRGRINNSAIDDIDSNELSTVTFGGSAPASPVSRLTPPSPHDPLNCGKDDIDSDEIITDDKEDTCEEGVKEEDKLPISAAELRAQKRKMKRFRYAVLWSCKRLLKLNHHLGSLITKHDS
jgi:hypothetical protein